MDGILNINKPLGVTSYSVIGKLKGITGERRIGHGGTLDPLACGVLPVFFGRATRVIEYFQKSKKIYKASIELGRTTVTYDAEGDITSEEDCSCVTEELLKDVLTKFTGNIKQLPPMYSAVKHNGKRLYELAREGKEVSRRERDATIYDIELEEWESPLFTISVECGKGTYIRSLADDIGKALGCGAYLKALERTKYGPFTLEEALTLEEAKKGVEGGVFEKSLYGIDYVLGKMPRLELNAEEAGKIKNGIIVPMEKPKGLEDETFEYSILRVYDENGCFIALTEYDEASFTLIPKKVFKI